MNLRQLRAFVLSHSRSPAATAAARAPN